MTRLAALAIVLLVACDNGGTTPDWSRMITQPKLLPYGKADQFANGAAMRPVPAGSVAREQVTDPRRGEGRDAQGQPIDELPIPVSRALLERGRDRYNIVCATCHGIAGDGDSAVARHMQRRRPPSLHEARLRALTPGALYRVIVDGYGLMPSYATMLEVDDRWAVVAYVRTLELSWRAQLDRLPAAVHADVLGRLR